MTNIDVRISKKVFNDCFLPLLDDTHRYLIIYGGSGSGKSYFVAQRYIRLMLINKMNLLVVRNTGRSNRDSTFALFQQVISSWNMHQLFTINKADMRIKCINGNEIIFSGLDDVEKLKSVTFSNGILTDIWVEEASEIQEADFNQLDIRLRGVGTRKQIILSFNPIDINHWIKRRFVDVKSQDVVVSHSTFLDNKFIDSDYRKTLESFKDTDEYYYNVYCLGNWGVLGKTIFDARKISERLQHLPKAILHGYFDYSYNGLAITHYALKTDENGYIQVFKAPQKNGLYCIGVDTAGEGSDYYVAWVLDAQTREQVAILRHQFDADQFTKQLYCLGRYYNDALLTVEMNFDTFPIKELERFGYPNLFVREQQDAFTGAIKKAYGFRTDSISRPRIISQLVEIVREHIELFNDKTTLEEMLTFVRNEKGRAEAQSGSHDDCVMACAIAHEGIKQVRIPFKFDDESNSYNDFLSYGT